MASVDYEPDPRGLGYAYYLKMWKFHYKIAQIDALTGQSETYGSLLKRCIRASMKLKTKGVTPDDIVISCSFNNMDCCVPLIASLFLGNKISALDPTLSVPDIVHLLKEVTPKVIFVQQDSIELIEQSVAQISATIEIVVFGSTEKHTPFEDFMQGGDEEMSFKPYQVSDLNEVALILFSSGTTGLPKGICLNHYHFMYQIQSLMDLQYDFSVILVPTSLYWLTANMFLTVNTFLGTVRIVVPKFETSLILKTITRYKPTFMFLTIIQLLEIADRESVGGTNVDSIKQILTGGVPVLPKQVLSVRQAFPKANFLTTYGQTETLLQTIFKPEEEQLVLQAEVVSSGKPLRGFTHRIVDIETEQILGPHQQGELRLQTKFKLGGYYKRNSSEVWDSQGWYKTGDVGYYDENNCFYIVDRIKELLKYRTWHVAPAAIENVLLTHPAVEKCLVIGIPHETDGDHPLALVVLKKSHEGTTSQEIKKFVDDRVDDRKQLRGGLRIVEKFPVQPTGKIKRWLIREMVRKGEI